MQDCRGCPLNARATQAVSGAGRRIARLMLVGERPGDTEDRASQPFVGPAGRLLDQTLVAAGVVRSGTYVTNVVKHFKWGIANGDAPRQAVAREIRACLPWLQHELALIEFAVIVLLGATAAQALLAKTFRVSVDRGTPIETDSGAQAVATVHPSLLRLPPDASRDRELRRLVADLQVAKSLLPPF